jgi:CheY-like chemotaxis protein
METQASNPSAPSALQGVVLYIEDVPISFAVVENILSLHPGLKLLHAESGEEGIRRVREERPDVVLLDLHLPDMSGVDVMRALSEDIAAGRFRVLVLTADRLTVDVFKAMSLGALEYLVKPVSLTTLESGLRRALERKG